ncbi:MAG: EamA family transporter [Thermoleophilia bacterium]|nr:EamA family transporter [Thermoleophilia bacterium]
MATSALLLALAAAFVHALWNVLLARARDVESATAVALVTAELVFAPVTWLTWDAHRSVWPFLAVTGLLQVTYFALLVTAYRTLPLSVVYPIARGGAPVLVLLIGAFALGRTTTWTQVAAVVLVVAGILLVRGLRQADPRGIAFGLLIATAIAGYTLVDKSGIRHAGPITYQELSMLAPAVVYAAAVLRIKGGGAVRAAIGPASMLAGVCTFAAYALVLAALQRAPAASVAAVRETSVVIAAVLAATVLKERVGTGRLAGAVLVAVGVGLLAL